MVNRSGKSAVLGLLMVGCAAPEPQRPAPVVVTTPDPSDEKPPSRPVPPPTSSRVSDRALFGDADQETRPRKRRKRKRQAPASLVGESTQSEHPMESGRRVTIREEADATDDEILAVIRANQKAIALCSADAHRRGGPATGTMEIAVTVDGRGRVRGARLLSEAYVGTVLGACMLRRIKEWRFPARGRRAKLVLPFVVEAY
jgi:hypothetical protein